MTGRRLYELLTNALGAQMSWQRKESVVPGSPVAWAFLTYADRAAFNRVAERIPMRKRATA